MRNECVWESAEPRRRAGGDSALPTSREFDSSPRTAESRRPGTSQPPPVLLPTSPPRGRDAPGPPHAHTRVLPKAGERLSPIRPPNITRPSKEIKALSVFNRNIPALGFTGEQMGTSRPGDVYGAGGNEAKWNVTARHRRRKASVAKVGELKAELGH